MQSVARMPRGSEETRSITSYIISQMSELGGSQGDTLTCATSKSQIGDVYQCLEDLSDIFGVPPVDTLRYPKIEGQRMALPVEGEYDFQGFCLLI